MTLFAISFSPGWLTFSASYGIECNMEHGPIDYKNKIPPLTYSCVKCGAHGCKLWREYNACSDYTKLVCCDCAGESQKKDVSNIDTDGKIECDGYKTDSIGWRVPAIPTEDGLTYWRYSSVPDMAIIWWKNLSTRVYKTVIDKIKSGYYESLWKNTLAGGIDDPYIISKNELKKDLLAENSTATEEMFEFAWKWGITNCFNIPRVFECFMDLILIKNG